jgi:hypothetical protein
MWTWIRKKRRRSESSRAYSSEDPEKLGDPEAPGLEPVAAESPPPKCGARGMGDTESARRDAFVVEASVADKTAFLPHYGMNRNRRRYEAFAKPPKEQDKGKIGSRRNRRRRKR